MAAHVPGSEVAFTPEDVLVWKTDYVSWMESPQGFIVDRRWDVDKERWIRKPSFLRLNEVLKRVLAEALAMDDGLFRYRRIILGFPKKTGKTAIEASVVEWFAWSQGSNGEIYLVANDKDQVKDRAFDDVAYSIRHSPWISATVYAGKGEILLRGNDTRIIALGQHYQSAAGSRHGLTCWDELWTYQTESHHRMWDEMTPVPTEDNSIQLVVTYAGYVPGTSGRTRERNLLWELYSENVGMMPNGEMEYAEGQGERIPGLEDLPVWRNGKTFIAWFHEAIQPWQTPEYYADERKTLRASSYLRLHENRWSGSSEDFIDLDWWDRSCRLPAPLLPNRRHLISLGVDYAPKHDRAAVVGTYYDWKEDKVKQGFHKIWHGSPTEPLHPAIVGNYIIQQYALYRVMNIRYDPYQFLGTALTLAGLGLPMEEWTSGDPNYVSMTESLFSILKYDRFSTYSDPECREHIAATVVENKQAGSRISKDKGAKNDYAVALAMAAHWTVLNSDKAQQRETQVIESPFADLSALPNVESLELQMLLPRELRDEPVEEDPYT